MQCFSVSFNCISNTNINNIGRNISVSKCDVVNFVVSFIFIDVQLQVESYVTNSLEMPQCKVSIYACRSIVLSQYTYTLEKDVSSAHNVHFSLIGTNNN